jgi:uncharacterized RDD family membrane protein YckC/uncharacterized protein (DUF2267 family)
MADSTGPGRPDRELAPQERQPLAARLLGRGARSAQRVAQVTGVEATAELLAEEAIVRAIESQAAERALARVLQGSIVEDAVEEAMRSPAVERALTDAIDSEMIDRVWQRLLASDEAQKLVERIAEAPEVRSAIAAQGVGLIDDVRREAARATHRLDGAFEGIVRRIFFRRRREGSSTHAGAVSRTVAMAIDAAILNAGFLALSAVITLVLSLAFGRGGNASAPAIAIGAGAWIAAGSAYLLTFWTLAGQTPGMRLVRIVLAAPEGRRLHPRRAVRRLAGLALSAVTLGLGFLGIVFRDERRGWQDQLADTDVIYEEVAATAAPWSEPVAGEDPMTP